MSGIAWILKLKFRNECEADHSSDSRSATFNRNFGPLFDTSVPRQKRTFHFADSGIGNGTPQKKRPANGADSKKDLWSWPFSGKVLGAHERAKAPQ
jgi:hypothetical protein